MPHVLLFLISSTMNAVAKASYATVAILASAESAFAAISAGTDKVETTLQGRNDNLETGVQRIIGFITNLLYLIAVCYALYGGFLILTSAGDEEKVKKGKTILLHGALGLLIIFLASSVVSFILRLVTAA
jgi:hypothetical protein